jgi:hypothetical protein
LLFILSLLFTFSLASTTAVVIMIILFLRKDESIIVFLRLVVCLYLVSIEIVVSNILFDFFRLLCIFLLLIIRMNTHGKNDYSIETFATSPYHRHYCSPMTMNEIQPRRNSYQLAIHTSKQTHSQQHHHHHHHHHYPSMFSSASSSMSSMNEHAHTSRSLYTVHDASSHRTSNDLKRSLSQPAVRLPDNDFLLENATYLLDSPVHALRPAHHKSRTTLAPTNPLSERSSVAIPDSIADSNYCSSVSTMPMTTVYRIVIVRSFASAFALASLLSTEVLQTSIHSNSTSFRSLFLLHLSASIGAFLAAIYASRIHQTRYRWTISDVLAYDRFSQILIVVATMFTGVWVAMQYFQSDERFLLMSAAISGISYSFMIVKTFEHILQLSTSLPIPHIKKLTMRLNIFAFIYNALCHLALTIGGTCLLAIVIYQEYRREYVLIASQPCLLMPCLQIFDQQDDSRPVLLPSLPAVRLNLTMYVNEKKQGRRQDQHH